MKLAFLSWPTAVLAAAVFSLSTLALKQRAENSGLQQRVDALLARQEQSQKAEEASRGRLMAQVRSLQDQVFQDRALINRYEAASRVPLGDQLKGLPSSMMGQPNRW